MHLTCGIFARRKLISYLEDSIPVTFPGKITFTNFFIDENLLVRRSERYRREYVSLKTTGGGGYKTNHFSDWLVLFHEFSSDWSYKRQIRKKWPFAEIGKIYVKLEFSAKMPKKVRIFEWLVL